MQLIDTYAPPSALPDRVGWQHQVQGANVEWLVAMVLQAHNHHLKEHKNAELVVAGIDALREFVATKALVQTFRGLSDANATAEFDRALADAKAKVTQADGDFDEVADKRPPQR